MPLFERLIDLDLIELHSIQFGSDAEQLKPWRDRKEIHEWNGRLKDFSDTAHLLSQLDLVISVDTAVAHLPLGPSTGLLGFCCPKTLISAGCVNGLLLLGIPQCVCFASMHMAIGSLLWISFRKRSTPCFCLTLKLWLRRGLLSDQTNARLV